MMKQESICPDCGDVHDIQEQFADFYSELCDAVFCGFHPDCMNGDGGMRHTSHEARTAANNVLLVLSDYGLNPFDTADTLPDPVPRVDTSKAAN